MANDEARDVVANLLMQYFIGALTIAAGPESRADAIFRFNLTGDLKGTWLMSLLPEKAGIFPDQPDTPVNGTINWNLSYESVAQFFKGKYRLSKAYENRELTIDADRPNLLKLARFFGAVANVDIAKVFNDPNRYLKESYMKLLFPPKKEEKEQDFGVDIITD